MNHHVALLLVLVDAEVLARYREFRAALLIGDQLGMHRAQLALLPLKEARSWLVRVTSSGDLPASVPIRHGKARPRVVRDQRHGTA